MTTADAFANLGGIVADLSRHLPRENRFQRLLGAFQRSFPCDAIALLELEGDQLVPRAVSGLSQDCLGRRFTVHSQPRLAQIMNSNRPVRFPADSALPDPYDGLVDSHDTHLYVHDCMGAALYIDGCPWGAITLDAMTPDTFAVIDPDVFEAFLSVAAATVRAADWISQLEERLSRRQVIQLSQKPSGTPDEIIGESSLIKQLQVEAETVAASDLTVLILGETGVGKELIARHIHRHSARASEPMIHVNCAALPENIAESELFGHVRGAFSGATDDRAGKFELAHEGTLFLDEIGELPLTVQAKLLRALQNGEIQRIGSDQSHTVDVRLITATNRDLKAEVAAGHFRADLYHRISVYPLVVPPLRERAEDILILAGYMLERDQRRLGLRGVRLSPKARKWLTGFSWPGNVRELEHCLSRGIIRALSRGHDKRRVIELDLWHLGADPIAPKPHLSEGAPAAETFDFNQDLDMNAAVDDFKRRLVMERLRMHGGNKAAASRSLGIDRSNFHRLLRRLEIPTE